MRSKTIKHFKLGDRGAGGASEDLPLNSHHALQSAGAAFHALADTMPQMVWSTLPDGSHDYYNARWYEFTGVPEGSTDGEGWSGMFHEEDQPGAWKNWRHSLATGEPYEVEYRLRHRSGEYRWMIGRALPVIDEHGEIQRWIGTCTDIEEQKRAALQNEILSHELSHRIKNIFAIVSGLISLTARAHATFAEPARDLLGRIAALGRAHEFVRPHTERSRPSAVQVTLASLLETIFDAYPAFSEGRIEVVGATISIDSKAATPVAMVFHELATNAMKYGALANESGRVCIEVREQGDLIVITWSEFGGAAVLPDPQSGFGSRLIDMAIRHQLGGDYRREWKPDGLEIEMQLRRERMEAARA